MSSKILRIFLNSWNTVSLISPHRELFTYLIHGSDDMCLFFVIYLHTQNLSVTWLESKTTHMSAPWVYFSRNFYPSVMPVFRVPMVCALTCLLSRHFCFIFLHIFPLLYYKFSLGRGHAFSHICCFNEWIKKTRKGENKRFLFIFW